MKTIKQVSKLSGASVRTLQYYDNIKLLTPRARSAAGYRLYDDADVTKLRRILLLRDLGFSLEEIRSLIDSPHPEQSLAFRRQKQLLCEKRRYTDEII